MVLLQDDNEIDSVLANVIQAEAGLSGTPKQSALPFQISGQGANNFASTMQSAQTNESATSRSESEAAPVGGRGRSAEKDSAKYSKPSASGLVTPIVKATSVQNATPIYAVAGNLQTTPAIVDLTASVVPFGSVVPSSASSGSDPEFRLAAGAEATKQIVSGGSEGQVQKDASTQRLTAAFDSRASAFASDAGTQTPVVELANSLNVAPAQESGSSLVRTVQTPLPPPEESQTGRPGPASSVATEAGVAGQVLQALPPSTSANVNATAPTLSPPLADFVGIPDRAGLQVVLLAPTPGAMPRSAMDPVSATNAFAGVGKSASDGRPPAGSSDLHVPVHTSAGLPPLVPDPAGGVKVATAFNQSEVDGKPHVGNGSGPESLAALAFSVIASRVTSAAEVLKPGLFHAVAAMKTGEATLRGEAHGQPSSTGAASSTAPFSNQEATRPKPLDSSANAPDANVQAESAGAAPSTPAGQANAVSQPGNPASVANVLAQVSPAANQDSGGLSAPLPAAQRPSPGDAAPTVLPAPGTVEVARLVAGVAQSEMHIGLRTQAFGSVEVHTVVRDSQVGLTVGSERGDLRTLLATEVSGLQSTFRQQDLRFDNIHFLETTAGTTAGFSGGADSQPHSSSQQHAPVAGFFSIHDPPEEPAEFDSSGGLQTRLNVHA